MVELWLPYGDSEVPVQVPDGNLLGTVFPEDLETVDDIRSEVLKVIRTTSKGKSLDQILDGKDEVVLVLEDPKGLLPLEMLLTPLLSELESIGIGRGDISILVAWTDQGSLSSSKVNAEIQERVPSDVQVFFHDPTRSGVVPLETTSAGTHLEINEIYANSDARIVLGEVRFDSLAGYTGLGTVVVPGLAGSQTIRECWSLALQGGCKRGETDENPLSRDVAEASEMAGVDFAINVVLDHNKEVAGVFGGEPQSTFEEAASLVDRIWKRPIDESADIVLVSAGGSPFDSTFYWAVDSIESALPATGEEGSIVLVAECRGGPGSTEMQEYVRASKEARHLRKVIKRETSPTGYKALRLREIMEQNRITLVSAMPDFYSKKIFGLATAKTANGGLASALRRQGSRSKVLAIPYGFSTTVTYPTG